MSRAALPDAAGLALPARRHLGRRRRQLRALQRARHGRGPLPVRRRATRRRERGRLRLARAHRPGLARLPAGRGPRPRSTATACTGRYAPARGPPLQPGQAPPRSLRPRPSPARSDWHDALSAIARTTPTATCRTRATARPTRSESVVVDPAFAWQGDRPPRTPWHRTVIYEAHVKGFTARHPDVPPSPRGTYAGLASPPRHRAPHAARRDRGRAAARARDA